MERQLSDSVTNGLREDIQRFLVSRPDLTAADLGRFTPLSEHTVRSFMNRNIAGGHEVVAELKKALDLVRSGDILPLGGQSAVTITEQEKRKPGRVRKTKHFYETQTVKRVAEVMDFCSEHASIGVITGDFGIGKTAAVAAWRRCPRGRSADSLSYEFDEFSVSNKIEFIQCLARLMSLPVTLGSQYAGTVFRSVCEHLREHPCLLVFDQAETIRARVGQLIRQIHDRTQDRGVGVVILAAPVLLSRLNRSGMSDLGALTSRVGIWAPLSGLTKGEFSAILKQEGIRDVDEPAFDLWWKATGGSMRRLMRSLALIHARHAGKRVTTKTIAGVSGHLWGMSLES